MKGDAAKLMALTMIGLALAYGVIWLVLWVMAICIVSPL